MLVIKKYWFYISIVILFLAFTFFRFYQISERSPFSWDQIDNAWAAKNILYNHQYPLLGMVAKQNSGFYIGPLYYYAIAPFYAATNYDPIASGIFAGVSAIVSFWGIYFVTNRIFDRKTTLIALLIQTVSTEAIQFDRVQWPVNFIPFLGLLGFYFLYRILQGKTKHILYLGLVLGLFFQIHFTAVLFALCIFCTLPFWPRTKATLLNSLGAVGIVLLFLIPNIVAEFMTKNSHTHSMFSYLSTYSHGFHLKRMIQIAIDAVAGINIYLPREIRGFIGWIPILFFIIVTTWHCLKKISKERNDKLKLVFLIILWYLIPWITFTIYSGETSDYYYGMNRYVSLLLIAYIFSWIWERKSVIGYLFVAGVLGYYAWTNIYSYFKWPERSELPRLRIEIKNRVNDGGYINFTLGDPKSYLFFYYKNLKGEKAY